MSDVTVTINRRAYQIACDDGQEGHLRRLGEVVDKRVAQLVEAMGQIGDQRLVVMASLLLADEIADVRGELERLEERLRSLEAGHPPDDAGEAESVDMLAARIERLAETFESA